MLELSESNIHLNATATNKLQAIEMAASALEQAGNVEQGYLQGMLGREQQTSTFSTSANVAKCTAVSSSPKTCVN